MVFRRISFAVFLLSIFAAGLTCQPGPSIELSDAKGYLFIIGGGRRPDDMMRKFAELAATHGTGKIVVIPNASAEPRETGPNTARALRGLCDNEVTWFTITPENVNEDSSLQHFENAGGVYFCGGVQTRLTELLLGTRMLETIRELYENGGTLGGTSAGAAIMSPLMITGDKIRHADEQSSSYNYRYLEGDYIATTEGFGFLPGTIIDQHFVKRERLTRLINVVIENPQHIGIGIDESTAIIRHPDNVIEVFGNSSVLIFDATSATIGPVDADDAFLLSAAGMRFHALKEGQRFDLKTLNLSE